MRISDWSSDVCSSDLWIEAGRLLLNEQPQTRTRHPVVAGDRIELDAEPERDETIEAQDIPIEVVHLDKSIAIINKPPGLTVHPGDRKSVVSGKSVSVRVDIGGRSNLKKKTQHTQRHCIQRHHQRANEQLKIS